MSILEIARAYVEKIQTLPGELHREARRKLFVELPAEAREHVKRLQKAAFFAPANAQLDQREEHLSPSGAYKLVTTPYGTGPHTWAYSQGLVYRKDRDQPIAEIQRNYGAFPFAWVEGHAQGDFLLAGEDYQGQTIIDLRTGARRDYLPAAARQGNGFCWAEIHPSPHGKLLCVSGCYWAAPYETRFYDFSNPMCPPWPALPTGDTSDEFFGWIDDEHARIGRYESIYEPLNKSESELSEARRNGEITDEDFDRYLDDEDHWKQREVGMREWVLPSPLACLTEYAKECLAWRKQKGTSVPSDFLLDVQVLLQRLSDTELEAFDESYTKTLTDWAFLNGEAQS